MSAQQVDMTFDEFIVALVALQGVGVVGRLILQRDFDAAVDDSGHPVGNCSTLAGFSGPLRALDDETDSESEEVHLRAGDAGVRLRRSDVSAIALSRPGFFIVLMAEVALLLEVPSIAHASKAGA